MQRDNAERVDERTSQAGRDAARLAAVQALYQMDMTQRDLSEVLEEFVVAPFRARRH